MKRIPLGRTGIEVSEYCLGTMTWGSQNTEAEGHQQIALALDHGVTFWDTAEMYPTNPVRAETIGATEAIIGTWFARQGGRDRVQLATKITGEGQRNVRDGAPITPDNLRAAVDASLARLQTDYIDLYQLHWPNRGSYHFRKMWDYAPRFDAGQVRDEMAAILRAADDLQRAGKVRAFGLSNETVWGTCQWLSIAAAEGLPRMQTIQNEYSVLCRQFDTDWAEMAMAEDIPLLAYSPLAAGLLSGKYAGDVTPDGTRRAVNADLGGRVTPQVFAAVAAWMGLAREWNLDPCRMALAFTRSRPYPCIPILGATTVEQLAINLSAADLALPDELLAEIEALRRQHPAPF